MTQVPRWTPTVHAIQRLKERFSITPESAVNYVNQIRARSRAKQTFIVQLACGSRYYLPTEKAEKGSHYSAYVSSGYTGHAGGDLLVRETLDKINKLFETKS